VLGVYILFLLFEEMPKMMVISGIISQIAHLSIIQTFPIFEILSPSFVTTVGNNKTFPRSLSYYKIKFLFPVMLVVNHYLAFQHFSSNYFSFSEVNTKSTSLHNELLILIFQMIAGAWIFYNLLVACAIHTFCVAVSK
jgi:Transmembrane adaptor Erv26